MLKKIVLSIGLLILLGSTLRAQIPTFTENFSSSGNLSSYNFKRSGGWAKNARIHAYAKNNSWRYQWGDITYYNGYIYAVWADNREDGVNHIYLDKIDKNGTHIYSTNIPVDEMVNPCYRPKIAIANSSHIYVVYIEDQTEYRRFYAMRFKDTGTSLNKMWTSPVKLDVYTDSKFAYAAQYKTSCDTIGNNLVAFMNQSWSGSWGYESLRYVREDGSLGGESHGYVTGDHGSYGGNILVNGGNRFLTVRERYYWGGKDEGIWGRRWQTNSSGGLSSVWGGKDLDSKGTVLSGAADQNVQAIDCNGTNFFVVWNDRRNGNHDIFLGKYLYSNGSRASGFDPEIRVNISTAGDQKNPDITKDYLNLLYIVWADAGTSPSWQLKMMKLQDDGVKKFGGDLTLERSDTESYIRGFNPRITSDNTNLYVAWYQYGGSDYYRIMMQKYDSSGGRLWNKPVSLIQGTYMRRSHGDSAKLTFSPKAATIKEVMVTNFTYSETNDGKVKLYLSNNAGANWFLATNGHSVLFTNTSSGGYLAGWDFRYKLVFESDGLGAQPEVDNFTLKAYQYYTGDFLYTLNTNLNYAGSNVLESFGVKQSMTNYILADGNNKGVYYVKLKNTGNGAGNFYIYGDASGGNFDVKYYAGSQDITENITSWTGYLVTSLGAGVGTNIRVEVTPSADTHEGEYYTFYLYSYVGKGAGIHDSLKMTAYCWKYRPDLLIKKDATDSYIGASVFENTTTILTQRIETNANSFLSGWEECHTNFVALKNSGISNDIITFETQVVSGNLSSWSIVYTNLTKHQAFIPPYSFSNIAPTQSNVIAIIHKPLSVASVDEDLKLRFLIKSEKTAIPNDPLRLDYAFWSNRAKKYEPDVFVTFDNFTIESGQNVYSYTNTSVTQAILKKTVPGTPLYFHVIVQNDGDNNDIFHLKMDSIQSNGWTTAYSNNAQDITHALTNALGTNIPLSSHTSMTILCKYLTTTNVPSGQWHNLKFQAISLSKPFYQDVCYVRPYNKILRPDLIVAVDTNSWIGENIYSTTGVEQSGYTRLESFSEDTQVYFFKVKNNSQTDPDTIYLQGSKGDSHWHIHYYTNSIDITSSVTQSVAFSLNTNQFKIVRAVVKVDPTATPDEKKILQFHIWSSEVPSQEDRAIFTNQAVELKPDLVVDGVGDGQYRTSTYEQSRYFEAISGLTNSGTLGLQNDGGSVESFRLQGIFSNVGGSLTNWIISVKAGNAEIVSSITNTGFIVSNLSPHDATNLSFKIYAKPYPVGDTNSAVGNFLYMKFMWMSETKNNRRDLGQIKNEIKRGLVDSFIMPGNVSYGLVSTNFLPNTNRYVLGIVPGYPASASFYMKNIGIYTDVFNSYIKISNKSPDWHFSITNDGADITSIITNSASPYTFTNKDGYSKSLKLTLDATNGIPVGTKIYFKNYFQTSTKWERKDRSYIMGIIVNGLPDLACTNIQTQQIIGWGKDAVVESLSDKIEETETNVYFYLLHNDVVGGSNANFIFKEQQRLGTANADVRYFTNNVLIPNSTISNGLVVNIASGSNRKVKMKVSLPGASSGTKAILKHSLTLQGYSQVEDTFFITNVKVNPSVYLGFDSTTSATQIISSTNDKTLTYTFIVTNNDVVQEQFYVQAEGGTPDWQIAYYYYNPSFGTYSNVTAILTNSGFLTPNLLGSQEAKFKANLYLSTNLYGETNRLFHVRAFSLKNNSRSNSLNYGAIIKDGIPDIYGTNKITSSVAGYGQSSTNELLFNDIEVFETNKYRLYLRNQDNSGQGTFLFKLTYMSTNFGWDIQSYSSSSSLLSLSDLTNGFYVTNNGGQKDYVDIYIVATNTNLVSGSGIKLSYSLNLKDYPSKIDSFSITNRLVKPDVYIGFKNSGLSEQKIITTNNHTISFQFIVTNKDLVPARFFVSAPSGNSDWSNTYFYDKNPDPLYTDYTNITSFVTTSTGYLTKLISGNTFEEFKVDLSLSSNIVGMSSNLFSVRAYTYKNHSISNHINFGALIHDGTPDLSISNCQAHVVASNATHDKIQIGQTNSYVFSLFNEETGGRGLFIFDESLKIGDASWKVQYFTNNLLLTDVTNEGYKLWLNGGETKNLTMKVVVTNTNLISSSQLIIKNHFYLSNYSEQRAVSSVITNTLVRPGVSIYLKNISRATLYKTNNQRIFVKLAVKNTDLVNDRFIVKGTSGVIPWNTVYSNTNLITSSLTNITGWTTRALGAYAEDYIKCYIDLDSSLGGNTNKTFSFSAVSMADTSKTNTVSFRIFIIDGIPELNVLHDSIIYTNSPDKAKIETFETNNYVYILSNAAQKGSGEFVFRKTYSSEPHAIVEYSTNSWISTIASSNLIKGIIYNLSGGESRQIAMRVSLSNSCPSSTKILEDNQFYLKAVPGFVDKTYVTNIAVAPQMGLQYEDGTVGTNYLVSTNNIQKSYTILLKNLDRVSEQAYLRCVTGNNPDWHLEFIRNTTSQTQTLTSFVTSSTGWLTPNLNYFQTESIRVELTLSSNLDGDTNYIVQLQARPLKDTNIITNLYLHIKIDDGQPNLSVTNLTQATVSSNSWFDKIEIGQTNTYIYKLKNNESKGKGTFGFKEISRDALNNWSVKYYDGTTKLSNLRAGYYFNLNGGETKNIKMHITLTNTNLSSGEKLILNNSFYLSNYQVQRFKEFSVTNKFVKPGVSIYLDNISASTVFWTNNQTKVVRLKIRNNDIENDHILVSATSGSGDWFSVYSNNSSDITAKIANVTGWTSGSYAGYAVGTIKLYLHLGTNLSGMTNKTFYFRAKSLNDTQRTDTTSFTVSIVDGSPKLDVYNSQTMSYSTNIYEKIESFETNSYVYVLSNTATAGRANFVFQGTPSGDHGVFEFFTNSTTGAITNVNFSSVTLPEIQNGLVLSIPGKQRRFIKVKIHTTNAPSAELEKLDNFRFYLKGYLNSIDLATIRNRTVSPNVSFAYSSTASKTNVVFTTNNHSISYPLIIKNNDEVDESFRLKALETNLSDWHLKFVSAYNGQDITTNVFSTNGWLTLKLSAHSSVQVDLTLTLSSNLKGKTNRLFHFTAAPMKNLTLKSNLYLSCNVIDGMPKLSVLNQNQTEGVKFSTKSTNLLSFVYVLSNLAGDGSADFKFAETEESFFDLYNGTNISSNPGFKISYETNGNPVVSTNFIVSIPGQSSVQVQVSLQYTNGNFLGKQISLRHKLYLIDTNSGIIYNTVCDTFAITNYLNNPYLSLHNAGYSTNVIAFTNITTNNQTISYVEVISNNDVINGTYHFSGSAGDTNWGVQYIRLDTPQNISTNVASGVDISIPAKSALRIQLNYTLTTNLLGSATNTLFFNVVNTADTNLTKKHTFFFAVIDGLPDIFVSNVQRQSQFGAGLFSLSQQKTFDKIERSETNLYVLSLSNYARGGSAVFYVKSTNQIQTGNWSVKFYDAQTNLDITSAITTGAYMRIAGQSATNIIAKVSSQLTNLSSSNVRFQVMLALSNYVFMRDVVAISNIGVAPKCQVKNASGNDSFWNFSDYKTAVGNFTTVQGSSIGFYFGVQNQDAVPEQFILKAPSGNSHFTVRYYLDGVNVVDLTPLITTTGYTTRNVVSGDFFRIRCSVTPTIDTVLGGVYTNYLIAQSVKNTNISSTNKATVTVDYYLIQGAITKAKDNTPIANATIIVNSAFGTSFEGKSDSDGKYAINVYSSKYLYSIQVDADGFVGKEISYFTSSRTNNLSVSLVPVNMNNESLDLRLFPNPLSSGESGNFVYSVTKSGPVAISIYDMRGHLVRNLVDENKEPGVYYKYWDGTGNDGAFLSRGLYIMFIKTSEGIVRKKIAIK